MVCRLQLLRWPLRARLAEKFEQPAEQQMKVAIVTGSLLYVRHGQLFLAVAICNLLALEAKAGISHA